MLKIREWINHPTLQQICLFTGLLVYFFAMGIYAAIVPNFIQQKVCSPDLEPDLNTVCNDTSLLLEGTDIVTARGIMREAVPVLSLLVGGSWRDATGQNKPLMFLALLGEVLGGCVLLLAAWHWSIPVWTASVVESVLYGVFGGNKAVYVAATCAVTDQSDEQQRTNRLMFYQIISYFGSCLASASSGFSLHLLGYKWFFASVTALHLLTIFLIAFSKESENRLGNGEKPQIFQKMKAIIKSRPNNLVVWIMLISCVVVNIYSLAETNLYLYYLQVTFDFSVKESGLYIAFRQLFGTVSAMILSPVFTKLLKWSDFRIGIISAFMTLIQRTLMTFAKTVVELILYAMLDFLKLFLESLPMSILTKCVKSEELGIFVSLRFVGGCLSPVLVLYIYDVVFSATAHRLPGAIFFVSAAITFLVLISFWLCYCIYKEPADILENDSTVSPDVENNESNKTSENNETVEKASGST